LLAYMYICHMGACKTSLRHWRLVCHTGFDPAPGSEYLLHGNPSLRTVQSHRDSGDALDDPSWCPDKKGEGLVVDEVKVECEVSPTCNADSRLGYGLSQGRGFLDYRESSETNPNVATHSPLHSLSDRDTVSMSIGPADSHGHILFDQVSNSNDWARAQGGGTTSGNSKEKRFLCMFCNKGFSCPQKVEIHQRVHTGEKPFSCTQCHKRFAQACDLKRHQRVHTGEKPYSCLQCEKRFSHQHHLKRHLKREPWITDGGGLRSGHLKGEIEVYGPYH
uniref:C2H2-type domain-containing protein n=1 Tax=Hucho hucho TaxID=62062 RepID=A0A4W5RSH2_9TELE